MKYDDLVLRVKKEAGKGMKPLGACSFHCQTRDGARPIDGFLLLVSLQSHDRKGYNRWELVWQVVDLLVAMSHLHTRCPGQVGMSLQTWSLAASVRGHSLCGFIPYTKHNHES